MSVEKVFEKEPLKPNSIQLVYCNDHGGQNGYRFTYETESEMLRKICNFLKTADLVKFDQELVLKNKE
jgi:hypothetical protein